MSFIKIIYETILDALFPISQEEREVLSLLPVDAYTSLPRAKMSPIPESCSIFSYKDPHVWRLIWCIKYKKSIQAAKIAGCAIYQTLSMFSRAACPIFIIPMPITSRRRRERGFNQCELIANEIERLRLDADNVVIVHDLLVRTHHKSRQTLKDRSERLDSAQGIFSVNEVAIEKLHRLCVSDYLMLVIDDVVTTGSTIRDAIYTLRNAGFEKTFGLSVAH
ncbi:MAG: hypothetical protein WCG02_02280 [Candidatus Taylorbacteria bacterium]